MNALVIKRRTQLEPTIANKIARAGHLRSWLFNPFKYIAGFGALLLGMCVIVASAFLGWLGTTHFDGVLDLHIGFEAPAWVFFVEGILNWICLAMPLYFFGLIIAKSAPRFIDVFCTQALARWPYLVAALVMLPEANRRFSADLVWMVVLMYRAYSVSCNLKGLVTIVTFIISLIGAEIMVKMALALLLP